MSSNINKLFILYVIMIFSLLILYIIIPKIQSCRTFEPFFRRRVRKIKDTIDDDNPTEEVEMNSKIPIRVPTKSESNTTQSGRNSRRWGRNFFRTRRNTTQSGRNSRRNTTQSGRNSTQSERNTTQSGRNYRKSRRNARRSRRNARRARRNSRRSKKSIFQFMRNSAEEEEIKSAAEEERQRLIREEQQRIAAEEAAVEAKLRQECQNSDLRVKIELKPKQTSVGFGTINYFFTKNNNDERMTDNYVLNTMIGSEDALNFGGIKTPEKYELCRGYVIQKLILNVSNNIEFSKLIITLQSDTREMVLSKTDDILYSGENEIDLGESAFHMVTKSS
jgi:hypothetical protein